MTDTFTLYLDLQNVINSPELPQYAQIEAWIRQTLIIEAEPQSPQAKYELTIRVVDREEIRTLNNTYRHKNKATNVLSFPYEDFSSETFNFDDALMDTQEIMSLALLGDLVICHDIVAQEAQKQNKPLIAHWAHMVVHGVLHLKGYDHIKDDEAETMAALEVAVLQHFAIADPYQ